MKRTTGYFIALVALVFLSLALLSEDATSAPQKIRGQQIDTGAIDTSHISQTFLPLTAYRFSKVFALMENDSQVRQASQSDTSQRAIVADSAAECGQLIDGFDMSAIGNGVSPGTAWLMAWDTTDGDLLWRDASGNVYLYECTTKTAARISAITSIDSATFADSAAEAGLADSAITVSQFPYGTKFVFNTGFNQGEWAQDTVNGYIRWEDFSATRFVYPDTSWVGNRIGGTLNNPTYWTRREGHATVNFLGGNLYAIGIDTALSGASHPENALASGYYIQFTSGTSANDSAGVTAGNLKQTQTRYDPEFVVKISTDASIAACRIYIGLASTTPMGSADPATRHVAAITYDSATDSATTSYWQCYTSDGSSSERASTSIAIVANTSYTFRVVFSGDGTACQFYVNGALVKTLTSFLPDVSTDLGYWVMIRTTNASAKYLNVSRIALVQD